MKSNVWREKFNKMNLLLDSVPFQIRYDDKMHERFETMGQINYYENIIYLDPDFHERDMLKTILHEIVEFINRNNEIGLSHHIVTDLETGIMRAIMQNPHLFKIYVDEAERDVFENVGEREEAEITVAEA